MAESKEPMDLKLSESNPEMFEAIKSIQSELSTEEVSDIEEINHSPALESDIEVPLSDFWSNKEEIESPKETKEEPELENEPLANLAETIKFKANGQEKEMSLDEVSKRLDIDKKALAAIPAASLQKAMAKLIGSEQAFSNLAKTKQQLKDLETKLPEYQKKAQLLDKLEEIKHDPKSLLNLITGQDYDSFMQDQIRKYNIMQNGSEADKRALEREERLAALERKLAAEEEAKVRESEMKQQSKIQSEKERLQSSLESEYFKHQFDLGNESDSNDLNEMLWVQAQQQMARYVKKYQDHPEFQDLLPKMAKKSFEDVAGKLKRLTTKPVQAKVDEAIAKKKQQAAEQVQISSVRNNNKIDPSLTSEKNPFEAIRKKFNFF